MSLYMIYLVTVIVSFIVINAAEFYRIRQVRSSDFAINLIAATIPLFNVLVAMFCVYTAIDDAERGV